MRSLAEDIGQVIGCGAHVIELQRLESGPFKMEETCSLEELGQLRDAGGNGALDAKLLPASASVEGWPSVELSEVTASYLRQGQPVQISNAPTKGWVRIFSEPDDSNEDAAEESVTDNFIGVGEVLEDGRIAPRRLVMTH